MLVRYPYLRRWQCGALLTNPNCHFLLAVGKKVVSSPKNIQTLSIKMAKETKAKVRGNSVSAAYV